MSSDPLLSHSHENGSSYPEETKWEIIRRCFGVPIFRVLPVERLFCGHWEIAAFMPTLVSLISLYTFSVYWSSIFPNLSSSAMKTVSAIMVTTFMSLFLWSYFGALSMDPGYLPYDWIRTKKLKYTDEEQMTGLAIRDDQFDFALANRPPFASFSRSSGRFVIRGDHICFWITNWVGKRNHKQFILMSLYGFLSCLTLIIWALMVPFSSSFRHTIHFSLIVSAGIFELCFGPSLAFVFISNIRDLRESATTITKFKQQESQEKGCIPSMQEICGDGSILSWIIPVPAFGEELIL